MSEKINVTKQYNSLWFMFHIESIYLWLKSNVSVIFTMQKFILILPCHSPFILLKI